MPLATAVGLIAQAAPWPPIIVLTALEPSKTLFQKFTQVSDFMTKPFKTEALLDSVQKALAKTTNGRA